MRTFLVMLLTGACCATLRADFSYDSKSQLTGGALYTMLRAMGPLARGAREPIVSTHLLKGNRMATITKDQTTIIDLDKETITDIDLRKKTYSVMTFAEIKQAMDDAIARAKQEKGKNSGEDSNVEANFKVSAKATGQSKNIGVLPAKEVILTMTLEGTNKNTGETGSMDITVDNWIAAVPGYEEVREFQRKLGEKIGFLYGSGMAQMGMARPETLQGFAEVSKEMSKVEGVPAESTMRMGGSSNGNPSGSAEPASSQQQTTQQQTSPGAAAVAGALGRLGGFGGFGRKKNKNQDQQAPAADQQKGGASSGVLVEMTTELTSFSSGPVDASKLEVPAGFKQVAPSAAQKRGQQ